MWERFAREGRSGLIMGDSARLSGRIEGVYWHEQPYIHARYFDEQERAKILADFPVAYIWTDRDRADQFSGEPVIAGGQFVIVRADHTD